MASQESQRNNQFEPKMFGKSLLRTGNLDNLSQLLLTKPRPWKCS